VGDTDLRREVGGMSLLVERRRGLEPVRRMAGMAGIVQEVQEEGDSMILPDRLSNIGLVVVGNNIGLEGDSSLVGQEVRVGARTLHRVLAIRVRVVPL
jgi:hypothetical protein